MKKQKAIDQYTYKTLIAMIPPQRKIIDVWVENSHICAMLDNGLRMKIKPYEIQRTKKV